MDLKLENIFLDDSQDISKVKIGDFGLALQGSSTQSGESRYHSRKSICGTVGYIAPEVIKHKSYSEAADVFSLGVMLYTLIVGYTPFLRSTPQKTASDTVQGRFDKCASTRWEDKSAEVKDLILRMLELHPESRITLDEVARHPWMACHCKA